MLKAASLFAMLKRNQWKGREGLESMQEERLRRLVDHAKERVPFYKKALSGIGVRSLDDLRSLPVLEKSDVAGHAESLLRTDVPKHSMGLMHTSGSTGTPLRLYFDSSDSLYGSALRFHTITECGFRMENRLANLSATEFPPSPFQRLIYRISTLSPLEPEERLLGRIRECGADALFAFPSTLALLSESNSRIERPLKMRLAISCSEHLSQSARKLFSGSFGCSVRNYYGSSESWSLGFECEKGSMHLNSDSVIMEIVDDEGNPQKAGKPGHVLITSLWRYSMPFIRYRIGDIASLGRSCPCGRGLHVISSLEGRHADFITLGSGRRVPWAFVQIPLSEIPWLVRFQCVQESVGRLRLLALVKSGSGKAGKNGEDELKRAVSEALPEPVETDIEFVDSIPRDRSGKMRDFISKTRAASP